MAPGFKSNRHVSQVFGFRVSQTIRKNTVVLLLNPHEKLLLPSSVPVGQLSASPIEN